VRPNGCNTSGSPEAGALLGGLDRRFFHAGGDVGETLGTTGAAEHLVALLHVREPVIEQREHVGGDFLAQTVAGAEVLVDPDLHRVSSSRYLSRVSGVRG
jgi:hypothetical protein